MGGVISYIMSSTIYSEILAVLVGYSIFIPLDSHIVGKKWPFSCYHLNPKHSFISAPFGLSSPFTKHRKCFVFFPSAFNLILRLFQSNKINLPPADQLFGTAFWQPHITLKPSVKGSKEPNSRCPVFLIVIM